MVFPLIQLAVVITFPLVYPINSGVRTGPGKRLEAVESPGNLLNSNNRVSRIYVVRNVC